MSTVRSKGSADRPRVQSRNLIARQHPARPLHETDEKFEFAARQARPRRAVDAQAAGVEIDDEGSKP